MQFLVTLTQLDSTQRRLFLNAESEEALYEIPGFADSIVSVWAVPLGLHLAQTKLPLPEQLLLVAQVATLVDSGAQIAKGLREIAASTPSLRHYLNDPRINHASTVSDYLEIFGANETVILLTKSGEQSGQLSEAINNAVENIEQEMELIKATGSDLKLGVTYLVSGTLSILLLSLILGGAAERIIEMDQLKENNATHMIVAIKSMQTDYTFFFLSILATVALGIRYAWKNIPQFRLLPGIKAFDDLLKARRSANFLSAWTPLFMSGIGPSKSLAILASNNHGENKDAIKSLKEGVDAGKTIPQSMESRYWSPSLITGMKAFDSAHDAARSKLLGRVRTMLVTEIFVTGKRFSGFALRTGMIAAVCTILLIAMGFYAPMLLSRGA